MEKTNVMRFLDGRKIPYKPYTYADTDAVSGVEVADVLGQNPAQVFKTLVTVGKSKKNYIFMIPVAEELDKSVDMIKSKEMLPLTGYVHGGCSPLGMKKAFKTVIDESADAFESIIFSAGRIGWQVEVKLEDLKKVLNFSTAALTVNNGE